MDEDRLATLTRRIDALERQNRRFRVVAMLTAAVALSTVMLGVPQRIADAQRAPGPLVAEGSINLMKNGVLRAQLAVDDSNKVRLVLYGVGGSAGVPSLPDFLHQSGLAAIDTDPLISLTTGATGTTVNITGGPTRSNILLGTDAAEGPALTFYSGSQSPTAQLLGSAGGQALLLVNGHAAGIDDSGNQTWLVPSEGTP